MQLVRRIYRSLVATIKYGLRTIQDRTRTLRKADRGPAQSVAQRGGANPGAGPGADLPVIAVVAVARRRAAKLVPGMGQPTDLKVAPPPGIQDPLAQVHSQQENDESLRRFHAGLGILIDPLVSGATYASRRPRKWRSHMPMLARAAADCLDAFPRLFHGAQLTGHDLKQLERQVQRLGSFLSLVNRAHKLLRAAHQSRKQELADRTMEIVDQVHHLAQLPQQAAELAEEIRDARLLVDAVLAPSHAEVRRRRGERATLREQAQAQTAPLAAKVRALDLEAKVLRGGSLSAADFQQQA